MPDGTYTRTYCAFASTFVREFVVSQLLRTSKADVRAWCMGARLSLQGGRSPWVQQVLSKLHVSCSCRSGCRHRCHCCYHVHHNSVLHIQTAGHTRSRRHCLYRVIYRSTNLIILTSPSFSFAIASLPLYLQLDCVVPSLRSWGMTCCVLGAASKHARSRDLTSLQPKVGAHHNAACHIIVHILHAISRCHTCDT